MGSRATRSPTLASDASMSQSIVPLLCAMPKKYVTPTSSTRMLSGKPATTSSSAMSAIQRPTTQATGNIAMPMLTLRMAAIANTATKIASAMSCSSMGRLPE